MCAKGMAVFLFAWKCWRNEVLSYCQLVTNSVGINLNHFLAPLVRVTANTLHFANSKTKCSSMRLLKWSRWSWGSDFLSYALIPGSLNPSSSLALCTSWLKGDPVAVANNSTSFSFMAAMARCKSSIRIPPCPPWPLQVVHFEWPTTETALDHAFCWAYPLGLPYDPTFRKLSPNCF